MKESSQAHQTSISPRVRGFLEATLLILAALLIYGHTLDSPFYLDDYTHILDNSAIRLTDLQAKELLAAGFDSPGQRRPLANVSFALNFYFHQYRLPGYHLVNIVIHILTGLALYAFLVATLRLPIDQWPFAVPHYEQGTSATVDPLAWISWMPFLTAMVWLVHPLHTQSVTYIVQRMNSLATLLYLVAVWLYVQARQANGTLQRWFLFTGVLISGLAALGSKEIALTLPIIIFLYEWFFFQKLDSNWFKKQIPLLLGLTALLSGVVYLYLNNPLDYIAGSYAGRNFDVWQRVLTEFRVIIRYLTLLMWPNPNRLSLEYDFPISQSLFEPLTTILSIMVIVGIAVTAVLTANRHRLLSFCILGFLVTLVIESSVLGLEIIFEHRTYLPSIFAAIFFSLIIPKCISKRFLLFSCYGLLVLLFAVWTFQRNALWRDEVGFLTDAVIKAPTNWRAHTNLANALAAKGQYDKALLAYKKALAHNPYKAARHSSEDGVATGAPSMHEAARRFSADLYSNMGNLLVRQGNLKEANTYLMRAMEYDPHHAKAHTSKGLIRADQGRIEEAIQYYRLALVADPNIVEALNNLGLALAAQGENLQAIESFNRAVELNPAFAEAYNNRGIQLAGRQDLEAAIADFSKAIFLRSDYVEAHYNLGMALLTDGQIKSAEASFQRAMSLQPNFKPAREAYEAIAGRGQK